MDQWDLKQPSISPATGRQAGDSQRQCQRQSRGHAWAWSKHVSRGKMHSIQHLVSSSRFVRIETATLSFCLVLLITATATPCWQFWAFLHPVYPKSSMSSLRAIQGCSIPRKSCFEPGVEQAKYSNPCPISGRVNEGRFHGPRLLCDSSAPPASWCQNTAASCSCASTCKPSFQIPSAGKPYGPMRESVFFMQAAGSPESQLPPCYEHCRQSRIMCKHPRTVPHNIAAWMSFSSQSRTVFLPHAASSSPYLQQERQRISADRTTPNTP